MYIGLHVKYRNSSDFNKTWIFPTYFPKINKYQIRLQLVQWDPNCSMPMDGGTDMTKLTVAFQTVANVLKKGTCNILVVNLI